MVWAVWGSFGRFRGDSGVFGRFRRCSGGSGGFGCFRAVSGSFRVLRGIPGVSGGLGGFGVSVALGRFPTISGAFGLCRAVYGVSGVRAVLGGFGRFRVVSGRRRGPCFRTCCLKHVFFCRKGVLNTFFLKKNITKNNKNMFFIGTEFLLKKTV